MNLHSTWLQGLFGIQDKIKSLVLNLDQLESFLSQMAIGGGHGRHCIPHETNGIVEEIALVDAIAAGPDQPTILMGQDGLHTRCSQCSSHIDAEDSGMGMGASQHTSIEHIGELHIRTVGGPSGDPLETIDSWSRVSDCLEFLNHDCPPFRRWPGQLPDSG